MNFPAIKIDVSNKDLVDDLQRLGFSAADLADGVITEAEASKLPTLSAKTILGIALIDEKIFPDKPLPATVDLSAHDLRSYKHMDDEYNLANPKARYEFEKASETESLGVLAARFKRLALIVSRPSSFGALMASTRFFEWGEPTVLSKKQFYRASQMALAAPKVSALTDNVGRLTFRDASGPFRAFGVGTLVAPNLLLTTSDNAKRALDRPDAAAFVVGRDVVSLRGVRLVEDASQKMALIVLPGKPGFPVRSMPVVGVDRTARSDRLFAVQFPKMSYDDVRSDEPLIAVGNALDIVVRSPLSYLITDITGARDAYFGEPLSNEEGEIIGLAASRMNNSLGFLPVPDDLKLKILSLAQR